MAQGRFRADLFHRLNVIGIDVPAIREREADGLRLLEHFMALEAKRAGRPTPALAKNVRQRLAGYDWPGNVTELRGLAARWAVTLKRPVVSWAQLPRHIRGYEPTAAGAGASTMRSVEDALIRKTLAEMNGNVSKTARALGINRSTIYRHGHRHGRPRND